MAGITPDIFNLSGIWLPSPPYILFPICLFGYWTKIFLWALSIKTINTKIKITKKIKAIIKNGGFVPGIRPGENTAQYFDYVLTRLTLVGAIYLGTVCIIPEIMISKFSVPFYFGGTSLLIVVVVMMDTIGQIQSHLYAHQYQDLLKKTDFKGSL